MIDWSAAAALAAVVWTNGVQRVPAGALVLRRAVAGPWAVVAADSPSTHWHVVGWWAPLTASLVLPRRELDPPVTPAAARRLEKRLAVRLRRARPYLRALRVIGALELVALVFGVTWAAARFGAWGLASGMAVVVLLSVLTAGTAALAFRAVGGAGRMAAARAAVPLLSPFGAPRAADALLERIVVDAPPELVARALLAREAFSSLIRPRAYDAGRASADGAGGQREHDSSLLRLLRADDLASIVATPPVDRTEGEPFCPRCGTSYRPGVAACGDCEGVFLVLPAG